MTELEKPASTALELEIEHKYLLKYVDGLHQLPPSRQFMGGMTIAFKSVKFLVKNPALWPNVAIPAAINFILFGMSAVFLVWNSGAIFSSFWAQPEGMLLILWWFFRVLLVPLLLVVSYFAVLILGGIVASPFNEILSGKTELILRGATVETEAGLKANTIGAARGVATSLLTGGCYVLCMIPILAVGLIPGIGSLIGTIAGGAVSSFFLAVEYTDHPLERRQYAFKRKLSTVWSHRPLSAGYGLGTSFLLWIPFLNFFAMPIAVIGGTTLGLSLDALGEEPAQTPTTNEVIDE